MKYGGLICLIATLASFPALAQSNPVPFVNQPLVPMTLPPGESSFTLTVNGTGFVSGSVVDWNGNSLVTTFVNGSQLTAAVPASDIASAGTAWVTVVNPTPGGGKSNVQYFDISNTVSTLTFTQLVPYALALQYQNGSNGTLADFNGDRKLDIAYAITYAGGTGVFVQLGNGDGSFQPPLTVATSDAAAVVSGDFNGDGKLDLALANSNGTVSILLGNGDGTFQAPHTFATGTTDPTQIMVGDFNRDGKLDVATATYETSSSISILLGNGDGTLQPHVDYTASAGAAAMVLGDFNGDGYLDLVYYGYTSTETYLALSFLQGNGDGTFQPPVTILLPAGYVNAMVAADINGDGKLDLIAAVQIAGTSVGAQEGGAWVWLGNGDGTFQGPTEYSTDSASSALAAQDFNADGQLDVVVGDSPPNEFFTFFGNGNGILQNPISFLLQASPSAALAGDFNGDGKMDLAFATETNASGDIAVFLQGDWPVASPSPVSLTFAPQAAGTTSPSSGVTLGNFGSAVLAVSSIGISGANASDFGETNNCGSSLAISALCHINVTFTPAASGNRMASLNVTDNAPGGTQTVVLTGIGADFSVAPSSSPSATITAGQTASYTLEVTPIGEFTQTVALSCTGAPAMSTCSLSPSSVVLSGSTAKSVTVNVTTAGSSAHLDPSSPASPKGSWVALWLTVPALFGLALLGGGSRKRRKRGIYGLVFLCAVSLGGMSLSCGGSNSSTSAGTPAGTYNLSITASFTSGSTTLTHSTKLTLVVAQ